MTRWILALVLAGTCVSVQAQAIRTLAGGATGDNGPVAQAHFNHPYDVTADSQGNLYLADTYNHRIRKLATNGTVSTIVGNGTSGFSGDGLSATDATVNFPLGAAVDAAGNVYIADTLNNRIRIVSASGTITTIAGNGTFGYSGDNGPATAAALARPRKVIVDNTGVIYFIDGGNSRIRKFTVNGTITTVAGNGTYGFSGDGGQATSAQLGDLQGLAIDTAGNLYVSDNYNSVGRVRKIDTSDTITTVAGGGSAGLGDGGPATDAKLVYPTGLDFDANGNLDIADQYGARIRQVTPGGIISTIAGTGTYGYSGDGGPATSATLTTPVAVAHDSAGNLYIVDADSAVIRKVDLADTITTMAGAGYAGDGGPATDAALSAPAGVAVDSTGNVYVADSQNNRIRKVATDGTITTVAGNGAFGQANSGMPATSTPLAYPRQVALDAEGNLYIASGNRIEKVDGNGIITTVAGKGSSGNGGDGGPATSAQLNAPDAVTVDSNGTLYIADTGSNRIRKVDSSGIITTLAGTGTPGFSGDQGAATSAQLNNPAGVAVDALGNVYIADTHNNRIRKIDPGGTITTVAGTGSYGYSGDGGPATSAELDQPRSVATDDAGSLYIADTGNQVIRMVTSAGEISTVAGNGTDGYSGDGGLPTEAQLNFPYRVNVDAQGNLYVADTHNNRIRKIFADLIFKDGFDRTGSL